MSSRILRTFALSVTAAATFASSAVFAEATGNVGVTSNYIWRGITQTGDDSAISGGLDYAHDSGFYVGTWASSLGGGNQYELDLYAGFAGEAAGLSYDVGVINYMYPVDKDVELDFMELQASLGYGPVTGYVAYTISKEADVDDENDLYVSLAANFDLKEDLSLGLLAGNYDFADDAAEDYSHFQISLTKSAGDAGDFTFAIDKASDYIDDTTVDEDPRVSVSWSKGFNL